MNRTLALALLVSALACSHAESPTDVREPIVTASLDREFDLRVGQRAEVGEGGFAVEFLSVREDSRCPVDVVCVWSGDAAVVLSLMVGRAMPRTATLHTHLEPRETIHDAYVVRLVRLAPYPDTRNPIEPDEYVATLLVTMAVPAERGSSSSP